MVVIQFLLSYSAKVLLYLDGKKLGRLESHVKYFCGPHGT